MAHSPTDDSTGADAESYQLGWKALNKLLMEGRSWSGNEANCAFLNTGTERFANVSAVSGLDFLDDARGVAVCDWDQDGALDLWLSNRTAPQTRFMRNLGPKRRFVSLRLRGTTCNGDAIGARVEIIPAEGDAGAPPGRLIRTLHAVDGYLSQSSKWLHFGLADTAAIDRAIVRWPGGATEEFTGLEVDGHYQLVQGTGHAEAVAIGARQPQLEPRVVEVPEPTEKARIVLGYRLPFPGLGYDNFSGERDRLPSGQGRLLVNIWGSDCAPCIGELGEFEKRRAELRAKNLTVVALSVDHPEDHAAARAVLERIGWGFDAGFANPELIEALDHIQRKLLYRQRRMPLPTSFLVSASGDIGVVYKGPLDVDVLLQDVELLEASPAAIRAAASPLTGHWLFHAEVGRDLALRVANELFEKDLLEAAGDIFLRIPVPSVDPDGPNARRLVEYRALALRFARGLAETNRLELARQVVARTLALQPDALPAFIKLGSSWDNGPEHASAEMLYRAVLDQKPRHLPARLGLVGALLRQKKATEAVLLLEALVEEKPENPNAHYLLAVAYDASGRAAKGTEHALQAVQLRPKNAKFRAYRDQRER